MQGERKSQRMREQVLELYRRGLGKQKIADALGISKNTVKGIIRSRELVVAEGVSVPAGATDWAATIPWEVIRGELGKKYVTVKCLHQDYAPGDVSYLRFWRELQRRLPELLEDQVRIRFQYKPGQRLEIDYCDGIPIMNPVTGERKSTHLFASVSAFSDYTFGEFVMTQKRDEFISSQERMFHFFGGVFDYVVVDNLKSGVHRAHIYDPDVNPVYVDYSNYMGFAVLPARPRTPRDKPTVETTIGVIQRQFYAEVRNRIFYSLEQLNICFREYLKRLNRTPMKDTGVSRAERFEEEKAVLRGLRAEPFEVTEYRKAKVHPDCHIQVDKNFYSVPYRLIGQTISVKLGLRMIEVFNSDHESVATHCRLRGRGVFSTCDSHYPEQKLAAVRFDVMLAKREAQRVGPKTEELVKTLLESPQPLKFLRRVQGILRLKKQYSAQAMEYASHQALLFNRPRLAYITDCVKRFDRVGVKPRVVASSPERDMENVYLQPQTRNEGEE